MDPMPLSSYLLEKPPIIKRKRMSELEISPNKIQKISDRCFKRLCDKILKVDGVKSEKENFEIECDFQSSSEKILNQDDDAVDTSGMKGKGSILVSHTVPEHENAGLEDRIRPHSRHEPVVEIEKGSSSMGWLECEDLDQGTKAENNNKLINSKTRNGGQCRLDALKDLLNQWEARCSNLESIVAEYKRKHGYVL
ncbi:OLC1v1022767C2 [Oldenlandia corymbosa var. corymbosa]|nr:OLC1v1022767C2 [Oldenlandia corymbosa var. corymbosa]